MEARTAGRTAVVVKALVHTGDIVGRLAEVEEEPACKLEEVRECMQEPGSCWGQNSLVQA